MAIMAYYFSLIFSLACVYSIQGFAFNSSTLPSHTASPYSYHGAHPDLKHYIVYMGEHSFPDAESLMSSNFEILSSFTGSVDEAKSKVVHHYHKSFRAFSAMLTPKQANDLKGHGSVVSVFEDKAYELHTTRSWNFMKELHQGYGTGFFERFRISTNNDVVIGHLDGGVWPESPSFQPNEGMKGGVPSYFRGECMTGPYFTKQNCNGKIVGARFYHEGFESVFGPLANQGVPYFLSPRDDFGHGTHTASTAAGNEVRNVISYGVSDLTVKGGAPNARISVYKACWFNKCAMSDILKALDDAVHDNVDIITASIGPNDPSSYLDDAFAIGSFHAFTKGILVVASAGNNGWDGGKTTVVNAPWILTVAASAVDREFLSDITLANGNILKGWGAQNGMDNFLPLVWGKDYPNTGSNSALSGTCEKNSLNGYYVRGKIVVCGIKKDASEWEKMDKAQVVKDAGGAGLIIVDDFNEKDTYVVTEMAVPTVIINSYLSDFLTQYAIESYGSYSVPYAKFSLTRTAIHVDVPSAPRMASFSAKGPNPITPDILKPDMTAPGVNILAAFPTSTDNPWQSYFGLNSGTSMACPHVAGVAAVVKAMNKDWSPAAIKSALMTSTSLRDNSGIGIRKTDTETQATPYDRGSGHLEPDRATSPGLVYDFGVEDLIKFLCFHTGDENKLKLMVGQYVNCPYPPVQPRDLNYPSIALTQIQESVTVARNLTWVGAGNPGAYTVSVSKPDTENVVVDPPTLDFRRGQTQTYQVHFGVPSDRYYYGFIRWSDGKHEVNTPYIVTTDYNYY